MTGPELKAALEKAGISTERVAADTGYTSQGVFRWFSIEEPLPVKVVNLLRGAGYDIKEPAQTKIPVNLTAVL